MLKSSLTYASMTPLTTYTACTLAKESDCEGASPRCKRKAAPSMPGCSGLTPSMEAT